MGETKTPHFDDFGFCEPVTKPQKPIIFSSLETPGHLNKIKNKSTNISEKYNFHHSWIFETPKL